MNHRRWRRVEETEQRGKFYMKTDPRDERLFNTNPTKTAIIRPAYEGEVIGGLPVLTDLVAVRRMGGFLMRVPVAHVPDEIAAELFDVSAAGGRDVFSLNEHRLH